MNASRARRTASTPRAWVSAPTLALLLAVLSLAPLAHSTPPDPSWVPGIYDAADFDDVVILVTASSAAVERGAPPAGRFVLAAGEPPPLHLAEAVPVGTARVPGDRAPPA